MGDVVSLDDFKKKKEARKAYYPAYPDEARRLFPIGWDRAVDRYQFELDKQLDSDWYLDNYFYPDYDW